MSQGFSRVTSLFIDTSQNYVSTPFGNTINWNNLYTNNPNLFNLILNQIGDIKNFDNMRLNDGKIVSQLSLDKQNEVIFLIKDFGYEFTKKHLETHTEESFVFDAPYDSLREAKIDDKNYIDDFTGKVLNKEGVYKCPKCDSENTVTIRAQVAAKDEGQTEYTLCGNCGFKWHG